MRHSAKLGYLLAPLLSLMSSGQALSSVQADQFDKLRSRLPQGDGKTRRGKGHQAKPAKRSNRATVSSRVRRKHRRAA